MIVDTYVALPSEEGAATPDPSVAKLFSAQTSAYAAGGTIDDIVRDYDAHGVDWGLIAKVPRDITPPFVPAMQMDDAKVHSTCEALARAVAAHPTRFMGAVGLDPKLGYQAARHVRIAVQEYGMRAIRILPMWTGIALDDPLSYPLYTAACDLGVPVCINVGVPGPMKPARLQRTILIDEVALCFPELKIVMSHVGDPWVDETVSMLVKHPNVYLMTAGFAPKYLPQQLVRYMASRGREKVMWSSYYPIMTVERTLREGRELPLKPEAMQGYLGDNAARVFGNPAPKPA
ncbi:MAG: amidohydrolase family protein [Gammaproteobacteria bacterium]